MSKRLESDAPWNADKIHVPRIELRVPGPWRAAPELAEALRAEGEGYEMDEAELVNAATGHRVQWGVTEHDDEIAALFAGTERLSQDEIDAVASHAVKVHLMGPGGSVEAAKAMMTAATAVVRAGGHGVFIDNSGLAHGRDDWFNLAEDKNAGGLYWAYVAGNQDNAQQVVFSCGMHCLGLRDAELPTREISDTQFAGFLLHNFLGYTYQSGRTIHDGDIVGGGPDQPDSPTFRAHQALCTRFAAGTPFHNPYGIWRLERMWPEEVQELKVEP